MRQFSHQSNPSHSPNLRLVWPGLLLEPRIGWWPGMWDSTSGPVFPTHGAGAGGSYRHNTLAACLTPRVLTAGITWTLVVCIASNLRELRGSADSWQAIFGLEAVSRTDPASRALPQPTVGAPSAAAFASTLTNGHAAGCASCPTATQFVACDRSGTRHAGSISDALP
jgi:hypothetical protein